MINRKELLEAMAQAIRCVDLYGQNDGHEYLEGSQKIAEAALDALLDRAIDTYSRIDERYRGEQLYQRLLSLRTEECFQWVADNPE